MELKAGFVCDRGLNRRRPVNQDRFLAVPEHGLFAVFDGVGGQRAGEVASQTAAETIEEAFAQKTSAPPDQLIRRAIQFANRDIFEMAESDPAYKTMATTVALVYINGDRATVAHVGDSRVYRLEDGHFHRETIDHTDLNDDIRAGRVNENQAVDLKDRNVINRALGVEAEVEVEISTVLVRDGARFLLCSDGIYRHLADEEIAQVLAQNKDPQRAADELKRLVYERGADDNLTAVVVQVGRARQSRVLAVTDNTPSMLDVKTVSARASSGASGVDRARGGRIEVEFGGSASDHAREPRSQRPGYYQENRSVDFSSREGRSVARKIAWALGVLVLMAAAFYLGLRASEWKGRPASDSNATNNMNDPLQIGRKAFDAGNYPAASAEFSALITRDPANAQAYYWMGRAQMEQRDYAGAAKSFNEAITRQPALFDSYVYAAAAYAAEGEREKAIEMLKQHAEARRKQAVPAGVSNSNSSAR